VFEVVQIFVAAGSQLVGLQIFEIHEVDLNPIDCIDNA
jgi:hypothetical protein